MSQSDSSASSPPRNRLHEWLPLVVGWLVVIALAGNALLHDRGKLLEAPFLAFLALVLLITVFHRALTTALSRGTLTIKWGDKEIAITDIEQNLDTQFDEMRSELSDLAAELEQLRQREPAQAAAPEVPPVAAAPVAPGAAPQPQPSPAPAADDNGLLQRIVTHFEVDAPMGGILFHLGTSRYKWRNQRTLMEKTGLPASTLDDFAATRPDLVVRSRAKSGNVIYRLTDQAKLSFFAL